MIQNILYGNKKKAQGKIIKATVTQSPCLFFFSFFFPMFSLMRFSLKHWSMCGMGSWLIHSSCTLFSALAACNSTLTAQKDGGSHNFSLEGCTLQPITQM